MTYAIMGVDWETHQGVGTGIQRYNVGDAGLIAYFSDGNGTHADWRADTFYIAPLDDPGCVRVTADRPRFQFLLTVSAVRPARRRIRRPARPAFPDSCGLDLTALQ